MRLSNCPTQARPRLEWGTGQTSGGTINYFLYYTATSHTGSAEPYPIYQYPIQTNGNVGPPISNSNAVPSQTTQGPVRFCVYSPTPSVSSNGNASGAILWAIENQNEQNQGGSSPNCSDTTDRLPAALHAFDAATMQQLYTSSGITVHQPGQATYPTPTVFSGRVYMGTWTEVDVFGLCGASYPPCLN